MGLLVGRAGVSVFLSPQRCPGLSAQRSQEGGVPSHSFESCPAALSRQRALPWRAYTLTPGRSPPATLAGTCGRSSPLHSTLSVYPVWCLPF